MNLFTGLVEKYERCSLALNTIQEHKVITDLTATSIVIQLSYT